MDDGRLVLSGEVLDAIDWEAYRAWRKHGDQSMVAGALSDHKRLAILLEEVGEVARELTYDGNTGGLKAELTQVAAMAAAWADNLQ